MNARVLLGLGVALVFLWTPSVSAQVGFTNEAVDACEALAIDCTAESCELGQVCAEWLPFPSCVPANRPGYLCALDVVDCPEEYGAFRVHTGSSASGDFYVCLESGELCDDLGDKGTSPETAAQCLGDTARDARSYWDSGDCDGDTKTNGDEFSDGTDPCDGPGAIPPADGGFPDGGTSEDAGGQDSGKIDVIGGADAGAPRPASGATYHGGGGCSVARPQSDTPNPVAWCAVGLALWALRRKP